MLKCEICNKEFDKKMALAGHKAHHVKRSGLDIVFQKERWKKLKDANILKYLESPERCKRCNCVIDYDNFLKKSADRRREFKLGKTAYNFFCSSSCAAIYNNTHKTTGNRKSKLEYYLEKELTLFYPNLEIHYNRKDTINSELDIYIPSLKLAFELNGIFHYEAIYGENKLEQIQNNDKRKFQACSESNIELCIIDSSKLKYFKESNAKPYLDIICDIINKKSHQIKT
jgi:hypothetical protein